MRGVRESEESKKSVCVWGGEGGVIVIEEAQNCEKEKIRLFYLVRMACRLPLIHSRLSLLFTSSSPSAEIPPLFLSMALSSSF